jgi:NAD(P)-dependent dehydrogenase (short-subunit alcohol dehydrogenase family)
MPPISGQFVLVIGGSSGIGKAVARLALAEGARVAIASSNPDRVANAVKALKSSVSNEQVAGYTCDITKPDFESRLERLLTELTQDGTQLDHIILTAAVLSLRPVKDLDLEYLQTAAVAFSAPLLIAKLAPRFLKNTYTSSLILTSGRVAERPVPGYTVSSTFGAGLFGMTRNLALDIAPLRVNVVSPGPTDTELWGSDEERAQRREFFSKTALLGKVGSPEEVAEAYIYLMKDTNATGACVSTSGGSLLQ